MESQVLCIDSGSFSTKCGFSGYSLPTAVFPSVVGRLKSPGIMLGIDNRDIFVGDEAIAMRGISKLKCPVEFGRITNWNDIEELWNHTFEELGVSPDQHSVLLTEQPNNPKRVQAKIVSVMMEEFGVKSISLMNTSVLSLFSVGLVSGVSVDIGNDKTIISSVANGQVINHSVKRLLLGGKDISETFNSYLSKRGYDDMTSKSIIRDLKESLCFVSGHGKFIDISEFEAINKNTKYILPDGSSLEIFKERYLAPEILFSPELYDDSSFSDQEGIDKLVKKSIHDCSGQHSKEFREKLYSKIVVSGGSSNLKGLSRRMKNEIIDEKNRNYCKIIVPEFREYAAWRGESVVSQLSSFTRNNWSLRIQDYDEFGISIIHRKFS